jgi:hypothetical protein
MVCAFTQAIDAKANAIVAASFFINTNLKRRLAQKYI